MNFRLTIHPAMENTKRWATYRFKSQLELMAAHDTAAKLLIFLQDELKVMNDYSNMFYAEERVDGVWEELEID